MESPRLIFANGVEFNSIQGYSSNYISSTKYNLITFLPKCLFQQFRRIANIYFLVTAVLQSIPIISPLQPFSAIAPFVFVLAISMIREAVEDYRRYRSDCETNSLPGFKYINGFEEVPSYQISVGDLIMVKKDSVFPCDLVFLASSEENGVGYIETSSLDGEKNLKQRKAFAKTESMLKEKEIIRMFCLVEVEPPNPRLYQFNAMIHFENKKHPLDKNNLLLNGAVLRNTQWVIGLAVYTGRETKLRMNLMDRTFKQSTVEAKVNRYILFIILLQMGMCAATAVLAAMSADKWRLHTYFSADFPGYINGVILFFTYFLLLNTMLPISLIVSLEIVKVIQAFFMEKALDMYSLHRDQPCKVFSSSLNEELGMIKHIFTDKTGTLTCNKMKFRFCTIGQRLYGYSPDKFEEVECFSANHLEDDLYGPAQGHFEPFRMIAGKLVLEVKDHKQVADQFLKCMTLCHECVVSRDTGKYAGPSPDEIALLETAKKLGYIYSEQSQGKIHLKIWPYGAKLMQVSECFEHFCTLDFSSDRKRNSVIVRDIGTGFVILYCKGADNVISARLSKSNLPATLEKINKDLLMYSSKGYRTLLLAFRVIYEAEFVAWKARYEEAARAIYGREEQIGLLADEIEQELILLGCTAVEDSLQEQVPETIRDLLQAGIKIWMLTGDKLETAVNIARTCGLVEDCTYVAQCTESDSEGCQEKMQEVLGKIREHSSTAVLVVEGQALELILAGHGLDGFFQVAEMCKTVICCRVSPGQKKKVVWVVKKRYGDISLCIGDGANDVSMILEANIGVGLYGEEGMQAVQASDFAIAEFRFLWDLILHHGRINYIRQSEMIMYFFYKNMVFTLPQFYFAFFCFYSGETVYEDWYITCYNMIFTALPLMVKAVLDKDVGGGNRGKGFGYSKGILLETYAIGRDNKLFTPGNFSIWVLIGLLHSALVFFIPLYASMNGILSESGQNSDFWSFSVTSFTCIILLVNVKLALSIRFWTIWHVISILLLSVSLYLGFIFVYDQMMVPIAGSIMTIAYSNTTFLTIFCVLSMASCMDIALVNFHKVFQPSSSDKLQRNIYKTPSKISPLN